LVYVAIATETFGIQLRAKRKYLRINGKDTDSEKTLHKLALPSCTDSEK